MITTLIEIEESLNQYETAVSVQEASVKATELSTGSACNILSSISAFGDKLKASIDIGMLDNIRLAMKQGVDLVKDALANVKEKIGQLKGFFLTMKDKFASLASGVKASILSFFNNLSSKFAGVMSAITSKLSDISNGFKGLMGGFVNSIKSFKFDLCNVNVNVSDAINNAESAVNNSASALTGAVKGAVDSLANSPTTIPEFNFDLPALA